jgi:hypothetical protein
VKASYQKKPSTPLHHLVVATRPKPGLELLLLSAQTMGFNSIVLGRNDSRPLGHWDKAFGLKMILVRDALALLPPNDWMIFTDAYDALFMRPAADLVHALERREAADPSHALLFNAESFEWPDFGKPYKTRNRRLPYLNSGVYAGRVGAVLGALSGGFTLETDDQRFFTSEYFGEAGVPTAGIAIDHGAEFFVCLAGFSQGEYDLGWKVINKQSVPIVRIREPTLAGAEPYIVHFNGNIGKVHMYRVAAHTLGHAGAVLAERAQWEGSISGYVLWPSRLLYMALLPWRFRSAINNAELADHCALAIFSAVVTWVVIQLANHRLSRGKACCCQRGNADSIAAAKSEA